MALIKYRREIDGLRALAVLPVVLFHAGFAAFSGGFVGVDVFFVISGYLITAIILAERSAAKFTLAGFYERRARRILPALFVVLAACLPFAWLWMTPSAMKDFSLSLAAVVTFASNILFWLKTGYFDNANELRPLLHTWSLAVEEQYYVCFPIFVLFIWNFGRKCWVASLIGIAALSLALAQWGAFHKPQPTFYLLPTRGWELLIGALVAIYHFNTDDRSVTLPAGSRLAQAGSALGVLMILGAIFSFDQHTPFPSLYALVPTVGAALIILFATPQTMAGALLGSSWMVGIGLISYSVYLWHQPLFAFARIQSLSNPTPWHFGLLSLASIVLAYLTWRFIEVPARNKQRFNRRTVFISAGLVSAVFACVALVAYSQDGFAHRFALPQPLIDSFVRLPKQKECFLKPHADRRSDWLCNLGTPHERASFLVFGDSHSQSLLPAFDDAATRSSAFGVIAGTTGCTPLLGIYALRRDQAEENCHLLNQRVFDYVKSQRIHTVFLVARWNYYTDGGYDGEDFSPIGLTARDTPDKEHSRSAFAAGLRDTVNAYASIGTRLLIVAQVPEQRFDPVKIYYRMYTADKSLLNSRLRELSVTPAQNSALQAFANAQFEQYRSGGHLGIVSLDDLYCDAHHCLIGNDAQSFYLDEDHLSPAGAQLASSRLQQFLR
jgi:peptidoglycan/LPS O-acetylase OafA/YrhL